MTTSCKATEIVEAGVDFTSVGWNASRVAVDSGARAFTQALALPFDAIRAQYVRAVKAGLIKRSMLAQRDFERSLGATERLLLGPWARRV